MVAILRNRLFVRNTIIVAVFYIPSVRIFKAVSFFKAITVRHLRISPLRNVAAIDKWTYLIGLKKEVAEAHKIMKLGFFPNYDLT